MNEGSVMVTGGVSSCICQVYLHTNSTRPSPGRRRGRAGQDFSDAGACGIRGLRRQLIRREKSVRLDFAIRLRRAVLPELPYDIHHNMIATADAAIEIKPVERGRPDDID